MAASRQGLQFLSASGQWNPFGATVSIPDSGYKEERQLSDVSEPTGKRGLSVSQSLENTDTFISKDGGLHFFLGLKLNHRAELAKYDQQIIIKKN